MTFCLFTQWPEEKKERGRKEVKGKCRHSASKTQVYCLISVKHSLRRFVKESDEVKETEEEESSRTGG